MQLHLEEVFFILMKRALSKFKMKPKAHIPIVLSAHLWTEDKKLLTQ